MHTAAHRLKDPQTRIHTDRQTDIKKDAQTQRHRDRETQRLNDAQTYVRRSDVAKYRISEQEVIG